ncbi:hypothetical protein C8R46DRAFT_1025924 [Mycena filopes]|nr:hypothetical protein C8R46DRAFT_1025924 [Mycena filopes]
MDFKLRVAVEHRRWVQQKPGETEHIMTQPGIEPRTPLDTFLRIMNLMRVQDLSLLGLLPHLNTLHESVETSLMKKKHLEKVIMTQPGTEPGLTRWPTEKKTASQLRVRELSLQGLVSLHPISDSLNANKLKLRATVERRRIQPPLRPMIIGNQLMRPGVKPGMPAERSTITKLMRMRHRVSFSSPPLHPIFNPDELKAEAARRGRTQGLVAKREAGDLMTQPGIEPRIPAVRQEEQWSARPLATGPLPLHPHSSPTQMNPTEVQAARGGRTQAVGAEKKQRKGDLMTQPGIEPRIPAIRREEQLSQCGCETSRHWASSSAPSSNSINPNEQIPSCAQRSNTGGWCSKNMGDIQYKL